MATKSTLAASVQAKGGRLYAVIQYKENGKRKDAWRTLSLDETANKTKVNKAFREVVTKFETEYELKLSRGDRPTADIPIFKYMCSFLERVKPTIQINTYRAYRSMIYGKIQRYFNEHSDLTVGNLKPKDIEQFYNYLFEFNIVANTVIRYHSVMRRAFHLAFKDEMIDANPFDRIERPKKNKFHGENYSEEELITLLELTKDDTIYPAIVLAGGLGLRRSEALGVRWSKIDFDKRTVLLDTKIVEFDRDGKNFVQPVEEMKNKSSRRTLPLPEPVFEMLMTQKEKQKYYRDLFKSSYNRKYEDYVCTNELGDLIKPSYVTSHFRDLLEKYGLRKIRFHDLRHTFASILLGKDVPLINVSNFLGHSDISTTANIYAHLDKASKQMSADIITDIFNKSKE